MDKYLVLLNLTQCNDALMESFIIQSEAGSCVISRVPWLCSLTHTRRHTRARAHIVVYLILEG